MRPRPIFKTLEDLIVIADQILPAAHNAILHRARLSELQLEIAEHILRPSERIRVIDDRATMLVTSLLRLATVPAAEHRDWLKLATVLRDAVHRQFGESFESEAVG